MSSGLEYCAGCGNEFQAWIEIDGKPFKESDFCDKCIKSLSKSQQPVSSIQKIPPINAQFTMKDVRYKVIASDRIKGIFTAKRIKSNN